MSDLHRMYPTPLVIGTTGEEVSVAQQRLDLKVLVNSLPRAKFE